MKASDKQVGGNHYKDFPIQPVEFITKNGLTFLQGNIIKRLCRYAKGGKGLEDLQKIIHEVELIIEMEGWGEEKHFIPRLKSQIEKNTREFEDALRKGVDRKIWAEDGKFTMGLPKLHLCKCGETPFQNWGNGFYWIVCPACHNVGSKSQLQYGAQTYWNEGEWNGEGI